MPNNPWRTTGSGIYVNPGAAWTTTATGNTVFYGRHTLTGATASTATTATLIWDPAMRALWNRPYRTMMPAQAPIREQPAPSPARAKARELLVGFLNPLQKDQYEKTGKFDIVGSDGTLYRIGPGTNGNVEWIDPATGTVKGRLCAHPRTYDYENRRIPEPDLHLGQLLALTTDERAWLEVANLHRGEWPPAHRERRIEVVQAA